LLAGIEIVSSSTNPHHGTMELPCLAFHCRDHSTALYTVSDGNLIADLNDGDADEVLRDKTVCQLREACCWFVIRTPWTLLCCALKTETRSTSHRL
jgi:hypothetical protein